MIRILRSTAFRIASAFALAVTATTYLVFALVYWQFYTANVTLVRLVLQDEIAKTEGAPIEQLRRQLDLRLTQDLRHLDYVALYNARGELTFGNVAATLVIPFDGKAHAAKVPPPQQEAWESENAIFVGRKRADGTAILLGRSLVYVDQLEAAMLHAFNAAIVPVIALALIVGTIVSLRASRRLTSIQDAINRVMAGELNVRLPARGTPDDIDELVRAVNLMLDEIGRLIAQIKSVGDNIAHDLRAPLAVMRARLERGLAGSSEDLLRNLTHQALADLERAMTTVTALLRISELETGMRRGAFAAVDLTLVCADAVELYAPLAEAKGVDLVLDAPHPTIVTGDADLLREAAANLIDNAIKFTPAGGCVRVTSGQSATLIAVQDNGPGIAPDEREKIVKRFYRSQATSDAPGVGLGLSMATTIVELHGFGLHIRDACPGAIFEIVPAAPSETILSTTGQSRRRGLEPLRRLLSARR